MLGETFHSRCVCHITSADIPFHSNHSISTEKCLIKYAPSQTGFILSLAPLRDPPLTARAPSQSDNGFILVMLAVQALTAGRFQLF